MTERETQAQEAAYLYAQRFSQQQLAEIFECSQSNISRLLKIAEAKGWLRFEVRFDSSGIPPRRMEEFKRRMESKALAESLKRIEPRNRVQVRNVRVYPSGRGTLDERLAAFGRLAASRGVELIARSKVVGVSFGTTLHRFIDGVGWSGLRQERSSPVTIAPVAGEVASYDRFGSSSTWLAHRLHEIVNGNDEPPKHSLAAVPFFIPRVFDKQKRRALRDWISNLRSYREVFSGDRALLPEMDCLFTSVGQDGKPLAAAGSELEEACGVSLGALSRLVVADLGGTLIPRADLDATERRLYDDIVASMTGLSLDALDKLARRGADLRLQQAQQVPGVCVVAIGENKAGSLVAALREGLVNELIIDEDLARAVHRQLR